jgi:hypothetical protein
MSASAFDDPDAAWSVAREVCRAAGRTAASRWLDRLRTMDPVTTAAALDARDRALDVAGAAIPASASPDVARLLRREVHAAFEAEVAERIGAEHKGIV